jgi:CheY-like chemotaxis protein
MTNKRILIIDDEKHLMLVLQVCLHKLGGWIVSTAESGREGLLKAATEKPDAILLDVMMPDLDGLTVLSRLREQSVTHNIQVILLTAKVQSVYQNEYAQLDIAGVLAKPFDPLKLADEVAQILGWSP